MLVHSSSMAVWSCWILAGTGTRCRIRRSRASQTCSMGDLSSEYAGHARTVMFSASRNCVQILATYICTLCIIMLQHDGRGWMAQQWASGSRHGISVHANAINKMHLCSFSITYACPYHNPPPPLWATRSTMLTSANRSPTRRHTRCLPSALYSENRDSSVKRTPLQNARRHRMWAFAHSSWLRWWTAVSSRPDEDDEHADELPWDGFWQVVQKFFGYANRLLQQLSGWLISDDLGGEDAGCGGPGLVWLHVVCGCEAGWMYCQILWNAFGDGLW